MPELLRVGERRCCSIGSARRWLADNIFQHRFDVSLPLFLIKRSFTRRSGLFVCVLLAFHYIIACYDIIINLDKVMVGGRTELPL